MTTGLYRKHKGPLALKLDQSGRLTTLSNSRVKIGTFSVELNLNTRDLETLSAYGFVVRA